MSLHRALGINKAGRDFVVGDIHGEYAHLLSKLKAVDFDVKQDRLFSAGDLIDYGPDSMALVRLIDQPWFYPVLGNHDEMFVQSYKYNSATYRRKRLFQGGRWSLNLTHDERQMAIGCLEALPLSYTVQGAHGRVGIVHASVPGYSWDRFRLMGYQGSAIWDRTTFHKARNNPKQSYIEDIDVVVLGHHNVSRVHHYGNLCFIDTLRTTNDLTLLSFEALFNLTGIRGDVHGRSGRGR